MLPEDAVAVVVSVRFLLVVVSWVVVVCPFHLVYREDPECDPAGCWLVGDAPVVGLFAMVWCWCRLLIPVVGDQGVVLVGSSAGLGSGPQVQGTTAAVSVSP